MSTDNLSLPLKMFNDRVRVMNQTQKKDLILTAQDARNLHAEIFALLSQIAELSRKPQAEPDAVQISMDGGGFR